MRQEQTSYCVTDYKSVSCQTTRMARKRVKNNLRYFREKRGINQPQVAMALGTSKQNIERHENGKVGAIPNHWLEKYAEFYNVEIADIFAVDPERKGTVSLGIDRELYNFAGRVIQQYCEAESIIMEPFAFAVAAVEAYEIALQEKNKGVTPSEILVLQRWLRKNKQAQ